MAYRRMRKLIVPLCCTALLLYAAFVSLQSVEEASSVHTSLLAQSGETNTLSVDIKQSSSPVANTQDPLTLLISVTYQGEKLKLEESDIALTEIEDTADTIQTPSNPVEIGTTDIFRVELTPSQDWSGGNRYGLSASVEPSSDSQRHGFAVFTTDIDNPDRNQILVEFSENLCTDAFNIESDREFTVDISIPSVEADMPNVTVEREFTRSTHDTSFAHALDFRWGGDAGDIVKIKANKETPATEATATLTTEEGTDASIKLTDECP